MDPVFLSFAGFEIRYYGLCYALAIIIGYKIAIADHKHWGLKKLSTDDLFDLVLFSFFGGLLGGRLYYVAFNFNHYFHSGKPWWEFLAMWHGGMAIHGALILGPLALWIGCRIKKVPFLNVTDMWATHFLYAQALGRIGNFMNGDAHGYPTDQPWGVVFPYGPAAQEFPGQATHPVMLYESGLNLIGWALLFKISRTKRQPGFMMCAYAITYSAIRFFCSMFRADDLYMFGLRAPHVVSIAAIIGSLILIMGFDLAKKVARPLKKGEKKKLNVPKAKA